MAKTPEAKTSLGKQFFNKTTNRSYNALVWGNFVEDEGRIEGNIGRDPKDRLRMEVFPPDSEIGKPAVTHYRVLERYGYVTLVECILETGRTHQIRAHMKHIGHPLFCDERYGGTGDTARGAECQLQGLYPELLQNLSPSGAPCPHAGICPPHYGRADGLLPQSGPPTWLPSSINGANIQIVNYK